MTLTNRTITYENYPIPFGVNGVEIMNQTPSIDPKKENLTSILSWDSINNGGDIVIEYDGSYRTVHITLPEATLANGIDRINFSIPIETQYYINPDYVNTYLNYCRQNNVGDLTELGMFVDLGYVTYQFTFYDAQTHLSDIQSFNAEIGDFVWVLFS
jgi:hypothetical protein